MTSNKGYRRETWLINLLIGMMLMLGGIGLFGLAQSQAALDAMVEKRVVATAQIAQDLSPANRSALAQQQADQARAESADAARLHGRLRAAILLTIVLGIGCAAVHGSGLPRHTVQPAQSEPPAAETVRDSNVVAPASRPTEAPAATTCEVSENWDGSNRRGPNRARNVARMPKKPATTDSNATRAGPREAADDWEPF